MIDIIIPTFGANTRLKQTLSAISKCNSIKSVNQIIVIENGEKADAQSICETFKNPDIKYIHQSKKGAVHARNIGIKESTSTHLLFLDDDIELKENAIKAYNLAIEKYGSNSYFSGPLIPKYEIAPPAWLKEFLPWSAKEYTLGNEEKEINHPGFLGGNICIPRKGVTTAGNYEGPGAVGRNAGGVGEENRLQVRLLERGFNAIWIPGASGHHWIPKNKCDIRFAIQRAYRHGLTDAINDKSTYPRILGVPRWTFRRLATETRSLLTALIKQCEVNEITEHRVKIAKTRGMIAGYKHGK